MLVLTTIEKLIFSQIVYELGTSDWSDVVKVLQKHPLIKTKPSRFTTQACRNIHQQLLADANLEQSATPLPAKASVNLKLAELHYATRLEELRGLIKTEEDKFKVLVHDIEEIRSEKEVKPDIEVKNSAEKAPSTPPKEVVIEEGIVIDAAHLKNETVSPPPQAPTRAVSEDASMTVASHPSPSSDHHPVKQTAALEPEEPSETDPSHSTRRSTRRKSTGATAPPVPLIAAPVTTSPSASGSTSAAAAPKLPAKRGRGRPPKNAPPHPLPPPPAEPALALDTPEVQMEQAPSASPAPAVETLPIRRQSKRKVSNTDSADVGSDKKRPRHESEPADDEDHGEGKSHDHRQPTGSSQSGPVASTTKARKKTEEQLASKKFQTVIGMLHSQISQHRNGNIFHNPIKPSEAPGYHDLVKRPMDLKTIKAKVKDGAITSSLEFQRDVYLMFANAMMYNRPNSNVYRLTEQMMIESVEQIQAFRQTEGFGRASVR